MATPLSDNIRALIAYANGKTQAGDTTLGGAFKTLCDGFGGGGNVPSSPFPVPRGPLSSRLAALLTYANETTGAGDTSIGDAVRTLVDGYGAGKELVFYEKIATDGNAYIDTGILGNGPISTNVTFVWEGGSTFSPDSVILGARVNSGDTRFFPSALNYNKLAIGQGIYSASSDAIGTPLTGGYTITHEATIVSGGSKQRISVPELNYEKEHTYYRTVPDTNKNMFLFRVNYQSPYPCSSYLNIKRVLIWNDTTRTNKVLHLVPCTYGGEAGMWDLVAGQFYGNAAASGIFTVEGEINPVFETPTIFWNAENMNGYSKELWANKGQYLPSTIGSSSDLGSGGGAVLITSSLLIAADQTVFLPISQLPRYVAITKFTTSNKFPVAHIGRTSINASTGGWRAFQSLRNLDSALYHIYDLKQLVDTYYQSLDGYEPALAIRTNMNTFVGCNDRSILQDYLSNL